MKWRNLKASQYSKPKSVRLMTRIESWPVKFGRQAKTSYAVKLTNTGDTYNVMEKERTLRTFIPRDQVAHGMQALAPTCQLGSVSTHRLTWALPVVDVNNGNERSR